MPFSPEGFTLEITTSSSFTSMYLTLSSPAARQNSIVTSLMCLPLEHISYSFGDALSTNFVTVKSWCSHRSAVPPPAELAVAEAG